MDQKGAAEDATGFPADSQAGANPHPLLEGPPRGGASPHISHEVAGPEHAHVALRPPLAPPPGPPPPGSPVAAAAEEPGGGAGPSSAGAQRSNRGVADKQRLLNKQMSKQAGELLYAPLMAQCLKSHPATHDFANS